METLRFLMVSTHYPPYHLGGDATMVKYLAEELVRMGHEVHVYHNPSVYLLLRGEKPRNNITESGFVTRHEYLPKDRRIDLLNSLSFGSWPRARKELNSLAGRLKPDIVHWHNTKGFVDRPYEIPGTATLYTAHDYYLVCPRSNLLRPNRQVCHEPKNCLLCTLRWGKPPQLWRSGSSRVLQLPEHASGIAPSEFIASRLRLEGVGICGVIRNFVPDPGIGSLANIRNRNVLLYLGMMEPHKDPETLLEGFRLSQEKHEFGLVFVGEGSQRGFIEQRVKSTGLGDRVRVTGFLPQEDLERLWKRVGYLVMPSKWFENAPLVVLEAYARGIPVISSDAGGLPEIVCADSGSLVFNAGDPDSLSKRLEEAWEGIDSLTIVGKKARDAYERRFRPEIGVSKYLDLVKNQPPAP